MPTNSVMTGDEPLLHSLLVGLELDEGLFVCVSSSTNCLHVFVAARNAG